MSKATVLLLNGSPRKKNCWHLLNEAAALIKQDGWNIDIVHLADYKIKDCKGCDACIKGYPCNIIDDVQVLKEKLQAAEGFIFVSPVYMCLISSHLKRFIDRTPEWFHRPVLIGKPSFTLITTAGSYQKESATYLRTIFNHWGTHYNGWSYRNSKTLNTALSYNELAPFIKALNSPSRGYRPTMKNLILFQVQKVLAQKIIAIDKTFWDEKGWSNAIFFTPVKINLLKRICSMLFYKILSSRIKNTLPPNK